MSCFITLTLKDHRIVMFNMDMISSIMPFVDVEDGTSIYTVDSEPVHVLESIFVIAEQIASRRKDDKEAV